MEYIIVSFQSLDERLFVEARQALEKAFELMPSMIRMIPLCQCRGTWPPSTYDEQKLSRAYRHASKTHEGCYGTCAAARNRASQIYAVMAEVDPKHDGVLNKAWECRNDSLTRKKIRPFSFDVIGLKIEFINREYWKDPKERENRLRILLFECEERCGQGPSCTLNDHV